jgi:hypothetical protein
LPRWSQHLPMCPHITVDRVAPSYWQVFIRTPKRRPFTPSRKPMRFSQAQWNPRKCPNLPRAHSVNKARGRDHRFCAGFV